MKPKVLIVHNYYQIPGGEDSVVENEIKLLEENGHEVILYSRNNLELRKYSKLQTLFLPLTTIFNFRTYKEIKKIIQDQEIKIVHVHNTLNLISPAVYYAAIRCKVPVVQTIHNFRLLCPGATFYRNGQICEDCVSKGLKCAIKYSCYRGSKLQTLACVISTEIHRMLGIYGKLNYIALTEFNKEKLLKLEQIKPEKVFVKPNFAKPNTVIIPYEKRENRFVFAGRLDKLKGVDILLEAWKLMGSSAPNLTICGTGPMEKWCRDFIMNNNLNMVEMRGFVPNHETKKIISNSKALILPTQWYEGFPMTIVEAYSVGTPVIGSDLGNVGNLIINDLNGWTFKNDSAKDLATIIVNHTNISTIDVTVSAEFNKYYSTEVNYKILCDIYSRCSVDA